MAYAPAPTPEQPDPDVLLHIAAATHDRRCVHLRYRSGDSVTQRDVEVFGLVPHWGRWYVVGHCHLRKAVRVFRADRIERATATDRPVAKRRRSNPLQLLLRQLAVGGPGLSVVVVLKIDLAEAQRRIPPGAALLTPTRGGVLLRAHVDDLERFARLLLSIGCDFSVRAPDELRTALGRVGRAALAIAHRREPSGAGEREGE